MLLFRYVANVLLIVGLSLQAQQPDAAPVNPDATSADPNATGKFDFLVVTAAAAPSANASPTH